ncbi:MAG: 5-(carboxyamino)imidazole ribonucleotide synthase [Candidatus Kerfeldbacteria bacterium]|nr:5-(carboxyamino)imidazole ribonucleotide synthase [Candidatus Kerfeldbacteria bacterium]
MNKTLGILGGGQLGRMLIQSAMNFNIPVRVLDPDAHAPCHTLGDQFVCGSFTDYETVYRFGQTVDVLTIEIEQVNVAALQHLEAEGKTVWPQARVIEIIQDKGAQKLFYQHHGILTADFTLCDSQADIQKYAGPWPVMQKLRQLGYDGRGVIKLNNPADISRAFSQPSLLEQVVDFDKEVAVIVARNQAGAIETFPTVEMNFHPQHNLVEFLIAPARIPEAIDQHARQLATQIAETLQVVGVLAVELFVTTTGQVLVNEIAPRPHNSGHHTIEGNVTSQFEQHLRAIFNWPLGDVATVQPAVMVNLLGEPGHTGVAYYQGLDAILQQSGVHVHLYGKRHTKPFRKMGHVTITAGSIEAALQTAHRVKQTLKVISV